MPVRRVNASDSAGAERRARDRQFRPLIAGNPVGFDGVSECWFKDEAQFLEAIQSDQWAMAVADADNVFDTSKLWGPVSRSVSSRMCPATPCDGAAKGH